MPVVEVPSRYRVPTKGEGRIEVEASTVLQCIEGVEAIYPGFQELIIDSRGAQARFVRLFLNQNSLTRDALDTPVAPNDVLTVVASAAGG